MNDISQYLDLEPNSISLKVSPNEKWLYILTNAYNQNLYAVEFEDPDDAPSGVGQYFVEESEPIQLGLAFKLSAEYQNLTSVFESAAMNWLIELEEGYFKAKNNDTDRFTKIDPDHVDFFSKDACGYSENIFLKEKDGFQNVGDAEDFEYEELDEVFTGGYTFENIAKILIISCDSLGNFTAEEVAEEEVIHKLKSLSSLISQEEKSEHDLIVMSDLDIDDIDAEAITTNSVCIRFALTKGDGRWPQMNEFSADELADIRKVLTLSIYFNKEELAENIDISIQEIEIIYDGIKSIEDLESLGFKDGQLTGYPSPIIRFYFNREITADRHQFVRSLWESSVRILAKKVAESDEEAFHCEDHNGYTSLLTDEDLEEWIYTLSLNNAFCGKRFSRDELLGSSSYEFEDFSYGSSFRIPFSEFALNL